MAETRTIGRYELKREIGRGAMGVVYEARDPLLDRTVALKTIRLESAGSPEELATFDQRFFAEARIAARLSHPGIVVIHDVGQDAASGELYIAMECLEGRPLSEILKLSGPLPWREALRITGRLAEALHFAHARGVVHRDLKPANVMLLASGEPKIMDFGIAKTQTARLKLTSAGESLGTPLYTSPEQVLGQTVDGRSDLFSLGAVAYSLLTGRTAFAAESLTRIVARVVADDPVPPSSLVPELPREVDRVIARALAKDPAERYPDGAALAEDVADLLAGQPPRHAKQSPLPPAEGRSEPPHALPERGRLVAEMSASQTHPHEPLDLDEAFAALVEPSGRETEPATPAAAQPSAERGPRPIPRGGGAIALAAIVVVGLAAAGWLMSSRRPPGPAAGTAGGQAAAARVGGSARPAASPAAARPVRAATSSAQRGQLAVRFEHPPRSAGVRVWVDRRLVAEERWSDRPDDATRLLRFGAEDAESLQLTPGGHDVEVEVAWDGKRARDRIWGEIKPGATRRLRAKVGGLLRKKLSLEWAS